MNIVEKSPSRLIYRSIDHRAHENYTPCQIHAPQCRNINTRDYASQVEYEDLIKKNRRSALTPTSVSSTFISHSPTVSCGSSHPRRSVRLANAPRLPKVKKEKQIT